MKKFSDFGASSQMVCFDKEMKPKPPALQSFVRSKININTAGLKNINL